MNRDFTSFAIRLCHNPDLGSRSDLSERNFPVENATCHVPLGLRLWRDPLRERLRLPNKKSNYDTASMTFCVRTTGTMEKEELKSIVECLLFFSDKPLSIEKLAEIMESGKFDEIKEAVEDLQKEYELRNSGLQVLNIAQGYQICTRSEFSRWVRKLYKAQTTFQLSLPALETLSIIAYKQPVTRGEIEKIRGVDASYVLRALLEKKMIRISGRKKLPGRPIIYGTSQEFLRYFGLKDLSEIPSLEEIKPPASR